MCESLKAKEKKSVTEQLAILLDDIVTFFVTILVELEKRI